MCASATDADRWDRRYSAPDLLWGAEPNRRLVDEVGALPPGRALDLGGGEGRNAAWLASRGWDVTIVDFSRVGLDRAGEMARRQGAALTAVHADLADYAPPEDAFDLVLIMYLQVPEQTLARVLHRASRALAPGGTLLLIGHDRENLAHGFGGPQDAAILQSPRQVIDALGTGLQVESAGRIERVVSTADGPRTAIDTLVRARRPPDAERRAPGA
jgi:SAM-dependent methyltransferase